MKRQLFMGMIGVCANAAFAQSAVLTPSAQVSPMVVGNAAVSAQNALYTKKTQLQKRNRCDDDQELENARAEKENVVPRIIVCAFRAERGDEIPYARVLADDVLNAKHKPLELGVQEANRGVPLRATSYGAITDWGNIQAWLR